MENYLSDLYERDLLKLKTELENFKDEASIWNTLEGIANPAGALAKHLLGNLNSHIGATLGKNGYIRNREYEFSHEAQPRKMLIAEIESAVK